MATLKDINRRINSVKSTSKITQAMRMVAAAKLKRSQDAIWSARPYVQKLGDTLSNLVDSAGENYSHPLMNKPKEIKNIAAVVIAADRGFCGSFNFNLYRYATKYIQDEIISKDYPTANIHYIPVGLKACDLLKHDNILQKYPGIFANLNFSIALEISDLLKNKFISGDIDKVIIFYNAFKNIISQVPSVTNLLPIENISAEKKVDKFNLDYIFEPNQKSILDELLPKHINIQVWRAILESNAAEQAARMMAMENATNNAKELITHLELQYNKKRQEIITTEMLEIVSGANALV